MRLLVIDTLEFRSDCTLDVIVCEATDGCEGIIYAYVFDGYIKIFDKIQDFHNWYYEGKEVKYMELTQDEYNSDFTDLKILAEFFGVDK